jgi:hypothetical protein
VVYLDAYDVSSEDKSVYYGQIQEIWELGFNGFKIPLFHCKWVDAIKCVVKDKYRFISIELHRPGRCKLKGDTPIYCPSRFLVHM